MTAIPLTAPAKHSQSRATHYAQTRQEWRESGVYLERDDCTIELYEAPAPCPPSKRTDTDDSLMTWQGVVIVVPSPGISPTVNKRAAKFWRKHGFVRRTPHNSPHFVEDYVNEWVRPCDVLLRGRRFSAKAWMAWVTKKHKELYS